MSALFACALLGFAQPLRASESGFHGNALHADSFSTLRGYVQQISLTEPDLIAAAQPRSGTAAQPGARDDAYAALRDFASQIGPEPAQSSGSGALKVAEADSLIGALQEMFDKNNAAQPATPAPKPMRTAAPPRGKPVEATYVGSKVCMGCHSTQAAAFAQTLMGRIGKTQKGKFECENCHGPGSAHVKAGGGRGVGGIISFRPNDTSRTADENNAVCLTCHERGDRTYWNGSPHETRGLMCTNCHTVMKVVSRKNQLKTAFEPETCFQCHKDRRMQMARSAHMPLREGKMVCSDCHNPHGSFTDAMLRTASINDTCYKCHAEKRGPFLFEHAPVRENCLNCHDPHGSVNEYLLKISRPRLCSECHTFDHGPNIANGTNLVFAFSRSCQNCHTEVHGTNSPSGALLHR